MALLLLLLVGCRVSGRLAYNKEDMRQAQELAERYLANLRDLKFEPAIALFSGSDDPKITAEGLRDSLDSRLGGVIQTWQLKDTNIIQESPRRILLLYQVQSTGLARDFEITTEMVPDPWHWIIARVGIVNDQATIDNAQQAQPTADLFLKLLQEHSFDRAYELLSPMAQKKNSTADWRSHWLKLEGVGGGVTAWELKNFYDTSTLVDGVRFPDTILVYMIHSPKGYITGLMKMVKASDEWQIDGLQIRDDLSL